MRWLRYTCMIALSVTLMGQSCGGSGGGAPPNGGGGDGGAAGDPGTGGAAGNAGQPGTGGTGGPRDDDDCGYLTTCVPGGVDLTCEVYCDDLCAGGVDDIFASTCLDDGRCWCWCATGVCSDDDCTPTAACTFENDESFCEAECANVCDGPDDIREAFCDGPGDTGTCECRCKVGGSVSCRPPF